MDGRGDHTATASPNPQMAGRWTSRPSYLTYPKLDGVVTRHYWRKLKSGVVRKGRRYTIFWGAGEMARRYRADEREEAEGRNVAPTFITNTTLETTATISYRARSEVRWCGHAIGRGSSRASGVRLWPVCRLPPTPDAVASRQSPVAARRRQ